MGIIQTPQQNPSEVGILPQSKQMVTTDNLQVITQPGYLNAISLQSASLLPTDILNVTYNYNPVTQAGNFGNFTLSFAANGIITMVPFQPTFSTITVTLTAAQILAMYATPQLLIPAPGAGFAIIVDQISFYYNFVTAAFASGGVNIVQYAATANGAGTNALSATIPAATLTTGSSRIYALGGNVGNALTGVTNQGIYLSNQTGAFTGGGASTVTVSLNYFNIFATV